MKVNGIEITFLVTTYADTFQRKAVLAMEKETGKLYGDVTINLPQYSLEEGESFLSEDCPMLIMKMLANDYLEIVGEVNVNFGVYKVGKFTQKFIDEFESKFENPMYNKGYDDGVSDGANSADIEVETD